MVSFLCLLLSAGGSLGKAPLRLIISTWLLGVSGWVIPFGLLSWHSTPLLAHKNATKTKIQKHWVYAPQVYPVGFFFALCLSCILVLGPRCIFLLLCWHQLFVDLVYLPVTDMTVLCGICTWVLDTCSSSMQKGPDWYSFYLSFNKQGVPVLLHGHSTRTLWFARSSLVFRGSWVFRKVSYKNLAQYCVLGAINAGRGPWESGCYQWGASLLLCMAPHKCYGCTCVRIRTYIWIRIYILPLLKKLQEWIWLQVEVMLLPACLQRLHSYEWPRLDWF